ncbi:MAG: hypothetical protein KGL35_05180 [Bradyrhizobium sp.]|nr:hypothetical protein [Bradyrhizobium sp.]
MTQSGGSAAASIAATPAFGGASVESADISEALDDMLGGKLKVKLLGGARDESKPE